MNSIQLILAGVFDRFPKLQIYWAETQIAWLPYVLEQMDDSWERGHHWMERSFGIRRLDRLPSEYIREHCWWGFLTDSIGVRTRHEVGIDKAMWGSDFSHAASNFPFSRQLLDKQFAGVPEEERYQMTVGNAVKFFHLENAA